MRRKSTRNASKASPDKVKEEKSSRKSRRTSKRNKQGSSESESDEDSIPIADLKHKGDTDETHEEINKRPKRNRNKSINYNEDNYDDFDNKSLRRYRRRFGSPKKDESQDIDDDNEEKKGKGKSKGKNKSKLDNTSQVNENEMQSEISENVQVTAQSPHIDNVDKIDDAADIVNKLEHDTVQMDHGENISQVPENEGADAPVLQETTIDNTNEIAEQEASSAVQINDNNKDDCNDAEKNDENAECENKHLDSKTEDKVVEEKECDGAKDTRTKVDDEVKVEENEINQAKIDENEVKVDEHQINQTKVDDEVRVDDNQKSIDGELSKKEPSEELPNSGQTDFEENNEISAISEEKKEPEKEISHENTIETEKVVSSENEAPSQLPESKEEIETEKEETSNQETIEQSYEKEEYNKSMEETGDESAEKQADIKETQEEDETPAVEKEEDNSFKENENIVQDKKNEMENNEVISCEENKSVENSFKENKIHEETKSISKSPKRICRPRKITERSNSPEEIPERDWGREFCGIDLMFHDVEISFVKIKEAYPEMALLEEQETKLEVPPSLERRLSEMNDHNKNKRKVSIEEKMETSQDSLNEAEMKDAFVDNIIAMNRKISIVDDDASKLRPPPSPSKNEKNEVLYITNLVRPFTIKQLRELLERTGSIREDGFWTDRIKSKCYVYYNTLEEAEATRNALHGVHWPIGNGKKLIIDYATPEALELAKNPPPPKVITPPVEPTEKENQEPEKLLIKKIRRESDGDLEKEKKIKLHHDNSWEHDRKKEDVHIRRSRSKDRVEKRRYSKSRHSRSLSHEIKRKIKKVEETMPQRAMDDLFRKTEATPCIYWQPLSPEEIALKQQQRLERMAEHKRRMESQSRSKRGGDHPRGGPFRRRY